MSDLVVIVPSRGRPHAVAELAQTFRETCTAETMLWFAVDLDDPMRAEYERASATSGFWSAVAPTNSRNMVQALNLAAERSLRLVPDAKAIVFMGDDHRPRTKGWDTAYLAALRDLGAGIVYGNDLFQGERLPTQCAMTSDIVRALGYMAPPGLVHLAVDDAWLALGRAADCIRYLPDTIIEHMHPLAHKAPVDAGYVRVNAPEMYRRDLAEFARWSREELPAAVAKVRALRAAAVAAT